MDMKRTNLSGKRMWKTARLKNDDSLISTTTKKLRWLHTTNYRDSALLVRFEKSIPLNSGLRAYGPESRSPECLVIGDRHRGLGAVRIHTFERDMVPGPDNGKSKV
jgi:hypothetical protein